VTGSEDRGDRGDRDDREEALRRYAGELADAVDQAIPRWVERVVRAVLDAQGIAVDAAMASRLEEAAGAARAAGAPRVRALLETDIDQQPTTPLTLLRDLVPFPTEVLRSAGARPVARDEFRQRSFPDDIYDLAPASFADVDPALHEPGLAWGAAKAYVHLGRHAPKGRPSPT
jgi:hypothetical protein